MKKPSLIFLAFAGLLICVGEINGSMFVPDRADTAVTAAAAAAGKKIAAGNEAFALDLYSKLKPDGGNLFFSPVGISSAFGMAYDGARGQTAKEIKSVLHFEADADGVDPSFKALRTGLLDSARKDGQLLDIANGLALEPGSVNDSFKAQVSRYYNADILPCSAGVINAWVKRKTMGRIEKIIDQLGDKTACVLLNAVYFKGTWACPFPKSRTAPAPFYVSADRKTDVPMMFQSDNMDLVENSEFQALSIPYKGGGLSMVILLPRKKSGLEDLECRLNIRNFNKWLEQLDAVNSTQVNVYLPKFKLEFDYDLVPEFKKLGLHDSFSSKAADFSGMCGKVGGLWIDQVKHKTFVDVNEEGTEAAAVTAINFAPTAAAPMPQKPKEFRADHPFIFLIRDGRTGTLLFIGRIVDPR